MEARTPVQGVVLVLEPVPATQEALASRSEEHTSELQSHVNLVCRLLLEKKKDQAFVFPQIRNVQLPESFNSNGIEYNSLKFIDSSYTQGLIIIQNDTIQYENYWRGQKEN